MIWLGTVPVKGFGITLAIGICRLDLLRLGFVNPLFLDFLGALARVRPGSSASIFLPHRDFDFSSVSAAPPSPPHGMLVLAGWSAWWSITTTSLGKDFTVADEIHRCLRRNGSRPMR